jgi:hypothetical protein
MRAFHVLFLVTVLAWQGAKTSERNEDLEELLHLHAQTREAHLKGDANLLVAGIGSQLIQVQDGNVETDTREQIREQFSDRFSRVKYLTWDDVTAPQVRVASDGSMAWMVIQIEARYRDRVGATLGQEHQFFSSWIATYEKQKSDWRMVGIASGVKRTDKGG